MLALATACWPVLLAGCGRQEARRSRSFETEPVEKRDIMVAVEAAGTVEPLTTVELKSKASGEILKAEGETGQVVQAGTLLVQIDKRTPRNLLAQAERAAGSRHGAAHHRQGAEQAVRKAAVRTQIINEVDFEKSQLEYANAKAEVVRSQVAVENARITLDDTDVRAPITGTIIEKLVETGQVISSPMMDVGGGTSLMKMADLTTVQVRALVDETDVGKIRPGKPVSVPGHRLPEPALSAARCTRSSRRPRQTRASPRSPCSSGCRTRQGLLRPGMNADVEIMVAERKDVLAVPTGALRTPREIATAAGAVGLDEATVASSLGQRPRQRAAKAPASAGNAGYEYGGRYWVFVDRDGKPVAVNVETGHHGPGLQRGPGRR